jgi:hypothetical protein
MGKKPKGSKPSKALTKKAGKKGKKTQDSDSSDAGMEFIPDSPQPNQDIRKVSKGSIDTTDLETAPVGLASNVDLGDLSEDTEYSDDGGQEGMDLEDDGSENEMSEDYDGMMGSSDGEGGDGEGEGDSGESEDSEAEKRFLETGVWEKSKKVMFEVPAKMKPVVEGDGEGDENMSVVSEEEENYYKKLKEKERKGVSEKVKKFLRKQLSGIGNKVKRKEFVQKRKELKKIVENKARRIRREASKLNPELKQIPVTTEAAKVTDDTYVFQTNEDLEEEERVGNPPPPKFL